MADSNILVPASFTMRDVAVKLQWPAAMIQATAENTQEEKRGMYKSMMSTLDETATDKNIDEVMSVADDNKPTKAMAFATYCTSQLWTDNIQGAKGIMAHQLNVGDSAEDLTTGKIYSLKYENTRVLQKSLFTVDDAIHGSTMYMNNIVEDFYDKNKTWAMTPLARICITDSNLKALAESANRPIADLVKALNISSCRKAHQLHQVISFCDLEMVAASIIP